MTGKKSDEGFDVTRDACENHGNNDDAIEEDHGGENGNEGNTTVIESSSGSATSMLSSTTAPSLATLATGCEDYATAFGDRNNNYLRLQFQHHLGFNGDISCNGIRTLSLPTSQRNAELPPTSLSVVDIIDAAISIVNGGRHQ